MARYDVTLPSGESYQIDSPTELSAGDVHMALAGLFEPESPSTDAIQGIPGLASGLHATQQMISAVPSATDGIASAASLLLGGPGRQRPNTATKNPRYIDPLQAQLDEILHPKPFVAPKKPVPFSFSVSDLFNSMLPNIGGFTAAPTRKAPSSGSSSSSVDQWIKSWTQIPIFEALIQQSLAAQTPGKPMTLGQPSSSAPQPILKGGQSSRQSPYGPFQKGWDSLFPFSQQDYAMSMYAQDATVPGKGGPVSREQAYQDVKRMFGAHIANNPDDYKGTSSPSQGYGAAGTPGYNISGGGGGSLRDFRKPRMTPEQESAFKTALDPTRVLAPVGKYLLDKKHQYETFVHKSPVLSLIEPQLSPLGIIQRQADALNKNIHNSVSPTVRPWLEGTVELVNPNQWAEGAVTAVTDPGGVGKGLFDALDTGFLHDFNKNPTPEEQSAARFTVISSVAQLLIAHGLKGAAAKFSASAKAGDLAGASKILGETGVAPEIVTKLIAHAKGEAAHGFSLEPQQTAGALQPFRKTPQGPLREARVPIPSHVFDQLGIPEGKVFADYEALRQKHPDQFVNAEDVQKHVGYVMQDPEWALQGNMPDHKLLVRSNGVDKAIVLEMEMKGGKYRVRSAYALDPGQLLQKLRKEGGQRLGANLEVPVRRSEAEAPENSISGPLTVPYDTGQSTTAPIIDDSGGINSSKSPAPPPPNTSATEIPDEGSQYGGSSEFGDPSSSLFRKRRPGNNDPDLLGPEEAAKYALDLRKMLRGRADIQDVGSDTVRRHLKDLTLVPQDILKDLDAYGLKIRMSDKSYIDHPDYAHLQDKTPASWKKGTYADSAGGYDGNTHAMMLGRGSSGSSSVALHETGHAIGHLYGYEDDPAWINIHTKAYTGLTTPDFIVDGPGGRIGRRELFAEAFAAATKNLTKAENEFAPEIINYLRSKNLIDRQGN